VSNTIEREIVSDRGMGDARLVELKPGRRGPCIFLVPGLWGRVEGFYELAALLETPMPLIAIESRGVDPTSKLDHDLEVMVRHYVDRIRTAQPNGPYFLIGHSFGGAVVFEMAQLILTMRERVACLILLDTPLPKRYWPRRYYLADLGPRMLGHVGRIMSDPFGQNVSYYTWRLRRRWQRLRNIPPDLTAGPKARRMLMAIGMMTKQWQPAFYPGRLTLFCCADGKLSTLYENRAAELETHLLAGDHIHMLEQPYVPSLARDVSACLARAPQACI